MPAAILMLLAILLALVFLFASITYIGQREFTKFSFSVIFCITSSLVFIGIACLGINKIPEKTIEVNLIDIKMGPEITQMAVYEHDGEKITTNITETMGKFIESRKIRITFYKQWQYLIYFYHKEKIEAIQ